MIFAVAAEYLLYYYYYDYYMIIMIMWFGGVSYNAKPQYHIVLLRSAYTRNKMYKFH